MKIDKLERWWDPLSGICLIIITFLSAYSLEVTRWTEDLNHVTASALITVIFGILIGYSAFNDRTAKWLISLFAFGIFLWQIVFSLSSHELWLTRLREYINRVGTSLGHLMQNSPVEDGILFLSITSILFIILSLSIGYSFTRQRKGWTPLIALVLIFLITKFYLPSFRRDTFSSVFYMILFFLFLGRQNYLKQKDEWMESGIKEDRGFSTVLIRVILSIVFFIGLMSWGLNFLITEYFPIRKPDNSEYWNRYSSSWEVVQNFFFPLSKQVGFGEGFFPESLPLGDSRSLRDDPVFIVDLPQSYSYNGPYYWKGRTFQNYENGVWKNDDARFTYTSRLQIDPYLPVNIEVEDFNFTYKYPREVIFTPQVFINVDRATQYFYISIGNGLQDVISLSDYSIIKREENIEASGGFVNTNETDLQKSGSIYPDWVRDSYLKLPEEINPKFQALAIDLTENKITNFEKVMAVTNFLRTNFIYTDEVVIPESMDPIEWFLFSGREGFCNFYASANVLLLRSIGIPTRLVVGYSEGDLINWGRAREVKIDDNHAWVEVFFPEIGWVIFEPTPSRPPIDYKQKEEDLIEPLLSREERILFGEQQSGTDNEELEELHEIAEKYLTEPTENIEEEHKEWIFAASLGVFGLVSVFIYLGISTLVVRKNSIPIPRAIDSLLTVRGLRTPEWITKWISYEILTPQERIYKKLKSVSTVLVSDKDHFETPLEFLAGIFDELGVSKEDFQSFNSAYHLSIYSNHETELYFVMYKEYRKLVMLIIREKIRRIFRGSKEKTLGRNNSI
jgi:transglutaminase-like putative cysteine protease